MKQLGSHPEGDALFHSLQVFDLAHRSTDDRVLWAAALFHDVGKAVDGPLHDEVGADLLEELLPARAVWLVRHHLDLLKVRRLTRRRYHGTPALADLELLRRWDLGGRSPSARVMSIDDALGLLYYDRAWSERASPSCFAPRPPAPGSCNVPAPSKGLLFLSCLVPCGAAHVLDGEAARSGTFTR